MKISVVIPAYNEENNIGGCLDSVRKHVDLHKHEIIVVDNNSTDNTATVAHSRQKVAVIHEARKGTGNARQTGAEAATGDVIAYLDADCTIGPDWITRIEKMFEDPNVVLLSGPYQYTDSTRFPNWLLNGMWLVFVPVAYWITGYIGNGGNCAVRKTALEKIGGNDRSIVFYGDDTDLARRLHTVGKTLWSNSFTVFTSARRFDEQGFGLYLTYFMNFWWSVVFQRPFTKGTHYTHSQQSTGTDL